MCNMWTSLTSEMSKWKCRVFPGRALEARSHSRAPGGSRGPGSLGGPEGCTRLAERDTTSFRMFRASLQWDVWRRHTHTHAHTHTG